MDCVVGLFWSGLASMSVKEVVQSLVDDGMIDTERIGTSNYFWAFPSKALHAVRHAPLSLSLFVYLSVNTYICLSTAEEETGRTHQASRRSQEAQVPQRQSANGFEARERRYSEFK